jgi:hypothetical protein
LGNLLYTRYLYSQEGVNPWIGCVGHAPETPIVGSTPDVEPQHEETIAFVDPETRIRNASYADMLKLLLEKRKQGLL